MPKVEIGEYVKVHLPGEWPWAIVTAIHHDTVIQARIDNDPESDMHPYKRGDVLTFQWRGVPQAPENPSWEVSPPHEQMPVGPREVDLDAPPARAD